MGQGLAKTVNDAWQKLEQETNIEMSDTVWSTFWTNALPVKDAQLSPLPNTMLIRLMKNNERNFAILIVSVGYPRIPQLMDPALCSLRCSICFEGAYNTRI